MSNGTTPAAETGAESGRSATPDSPFDRLSGLRERSSGERGPGVVVGSGLAALVAVGVARAVDVLWNLPFGPTVLPTAIRDLSAAGTPVVLALACVAVALATDRTTVRVGFLFVGVFGFLATVARAATVPAAVAVVLGGVVVLLGAEGRPSTYRSLRRRAVALGVLAGVAVSLGSSVGVLDGGMRAVGGLFAFGAATAAVVRVDGDRVALLAGFLAFAAAVAASATYPLVVGSTLLVALAAAGVSHLFVAGAVGAVTAVTVAGLRRREHALVVGGPLLLLAGVPATVPRALAVVLGATLLLVDVDALRASRERTGEEVSA